MVGRTGRVKKGLTEETWIKGEILYGQKALSDLERLVWSAEIPMRCSSPFYLISFKCCTKLCLPTSRGRELIHSQDSPNSKKVLAL